MLVWNINGTDAAKLIQRDTYQYMEQFDVVILTETQSTAPLDSLFPHHDVYHTRASRKGKHGEGLLLAVRRHHAYFSQKWREDASSLWIKLSPTSLQQAPIFIAACYLPPAGSKQPKGVSLTTRLEHIAENADAALRMGRVLIAGDMNARVGAHAESDTSPPRGCTDLGSNQHGRCLLSLCAHSDLILCTGRLAGDEAALPTFKQKRGCQATRLDHVLACPAAFPDISSCLVNQDPLRGETDHYPLEVLFSAPWISGTPFVQNGQALERARWRRDHQLRYAEALQPRALEACSATAANDQVLPAFEMLLQEVTRAAACSGMQRRPTRSGTAARKHAQFYDLECLELKRPWHRHAKQWPKTPETKELEKRYKRLTRHKKRAFERAECLRLAEQLREDPMAFHKAMRTKQHPFPPQLQQPIVWEGYLRTMATRPVPADVSIPPDSLQQFRHLTVETLLHAKRLNAPFDVEETLQGLQNLRNGRSPGPSGLAAELLRYACIPRANSSDADGKPPPHILASTITDVLNAALRVGEVPRALNTSHVTPVHKRGDTAEPSNYRPIAVGEPIIRLYANMINRRLITYTEEKNLRAPTQAGFRPRLSVLHQLFTLQHLIARARHTKQPFHCCFLDLKGAFDRAPRALLWEALQRRGLHGEILGAIKSLHTHADYAMQIQGRRGESIESTIGVKQGCPLSPTLFGLLMDGLHIDLRLQFPFAGPQLNAGAYWCGQYIRDLCYADDHCFLASTPLQVYLVLDFVFDWLARTGMEISAEKTGIMTFGATSISGKEWNVRGKELQQLTRYKYLGLELTAADGVAGTFDHLHKRLFGSYHSLWHKFGNLHCGISQQMQLQLFEGSVPQAASFGCEIWALLRLGKAHAKQRTQLAQGYLQLTRRLCRVRCTVCEGVLLRELGIRPLEVLWWRQVIHFWNNLVDSPQKAMFRMVLKSEILDASKHNVRKWAHALHAGLIRLGYVFQLDVLTPPGWAPPSSP